MVAKLFTKAFGVGGDKAPIPNSTQVDGTVSYESGFGADYERQLGVDPAAKNIGRLTFNELMFDATTSLQEMQAGFGTSVYSLALAQALPGGGYPKGAVIPSLDGNSFWFNRTPNNVTNPDTGGAGWVPLLRYGGYASFSTITTSAALAIGSVNLVTVVGLTPTLPVLANTLAGDSVTVAARLDTTIAISGAGQINYPDTGSTASFVVQAGEQVCFVSNGSTAWSCAYAVKNPQYQAYTAFTTAGTAAALTLTPQPAVAALAAPLRFRVKFSQASTPTSTINVSGTGTRLLKQYDSSGTKIPAVYAVNQLSDIEYDGTDWVLLNSLPGGSGVTRPQFDNTTNLATTAFVQGVGFQYRDMIYLSGATALTAAAHAGTVLIGLSNSAFNVQLPLASSMPAKTTFTFWNYFPGTMTLVCAGSDGIFAPGSSATFQIPSGMSFTLVSNGGTSWYAIGTQNTVGVIGTARNLTGSATGLNAVATFAADEIVVENSFNSYQVLRAMSISPSLANPIGANGLDTGSVGGAVSTWYSVWVIWNGSTVSGLFSLSATSPTMPAGYTHKALVGWARTDATGSKFLLGMTWIGARWSWKVAAGTNLAAMPIMASGSVGSITTPTWIAVPWASFAPPTAKRITVVSSNGSGTTIVAPNNSYGSSTSTTNPSPVQNSAGTAQLSWLADLILESSNIYWASNAAGAGLFASGGEI